MKTQIKRKIIGEKNNNYFLIDNNNILIGEINNKLLFVAKYNINYNSLQIVHQEINLLLKNRIEEYIHNRNCNNYNSNKQILKINNNVVIGELIVFHNKNQNMYLSPNKNNENHENSSIDNNKLKNNNKKINFKKLNNYSRSPIIRNRNLKKSNINASKSRQKNKRPKNFKL